MTPASQGVELPSDVEQAVGPRLEAGERVLAVLECDLDESLAYARAALVLTNRRLFSWQPEGPLATWRQTEVAELKLASHGPTGSLSLLGSTERLAVFRFTAGQTGQARRIVEQWTALQSGDLDEAEAPAICPSCGGPLPPGENQCPTCTPKIQPRAHVSLLRLLPFAGPWKWTIGLGILLQLTMTAASMVPPYLTMPLMDRVLIPANEGRPFSTRLAALCLLGLAGSALVAWLLDWAKRYVLAWVSERVLASLRNHTYAHLHRLSLEFFGRKRTGDLISRLSSDTDRINNFIVLYVVEFVNDMAMIAMTSVILLVIHPLLAVVTLVPFPVIAYLVHRARKRLRRAYGQNFRAWSDMTSALVDTIPGIRVVKAFAQERREIARFKRSNDEVVQAADRINKTWSFFGPTVSLLTEVGLLVVWSFAVWQVTRGGITAGTVIMFVAYIGRFYGKLESLSLMAGATQRAANAAQRIFEILDCKPSVAEPVKPVQPGKLRGQIELRDVCFQYGNRRVLHDVGLSIRPGEMIGLVGPSGAGKSTLVNLVCRFYDVAQGAILVDGVDIRSYPIEAYRKRIGIVLQEPFLFFGTIAENIAYGRPDATREEVVATARAARAHEFILKLPEGYDSIVGERGQSLSGGERQRISIARALLIDPAILILDEATSSVDTETEREIQLALENLTRGRTTIAIAHRLSTLRRADRVVVLEQGRVVEVGPHEELLQSSGRYAKLHKAQFDTTSPESGAAEDEAPEREEVRSG
ncbi:MAG: ABC transporter ATP-binding protein [Planctomycetia bacterium]|nr:ABC transporter ATP-binding protein [Planctomycetia bacterium]